MNKKKVAGIGLAAAMGIGLFGFTTCVRYIPPNENGVKKVNFEVPGLTGEKGWQEEVLEGGRWRIVWPIAESLYTAPRDIQVMSYNHTEPEKIDRKYRRMKPAARIETPDTFHVDLDVDIFYRINDPFKTFSKVGTGTLYESAVMDQFTEQGLKRTFGKLLPEDFFHLNEETNLPTRLAAQVDSVEQLNLVMNEFGIETMDSRIRHPEYVRPVQEKFEMKSQEDQRVKTNGALAAVEGKKALLEKLTQEGIAARDVRLQEGIAYRNEIDGKIEAYQQTKRSEGDKLVTMAEAEATRLRNEALKGQGAELLVGLEAAKLVCNYDRILVPICGDKAVSPLNLNDMVGQWE